MHALFQEEGILQEGTREFKAPLVPICLYSWARYLVLIASLSWTHQGGIGHGKYYNLNVNIVCPCPVARPT